MQNNSPHNLFNKIRTQIIFKFSVALIFLVCLDVIFGTIIRYFYFRQTSGPDFVTTYSIEKANAAIIIFGSSRANHHYHPGIFEEQLKLSCHNAGRDGFDILYNYAILKAVLSRYKPEIVILDLNTEEFRKIQGSYDKLSALLPYYKSHPEIRGIVDLKSKIEKIKTLSHVYPFNSTLSYIILGNTEFNRKRRNEINGYVPLMKTCSDSFNNFYVSNDYALDSKKVEIFEEFIKDCIDAKIKLYIINSPYFDRYQNSDKSIDIGQNIAKKYNVPFYDFLNDTAFINHRDLFYDGSHLNNEGATIFTIEIIEKIKKN
jgi:hypothetical protein